MWSRKRVLKKDQKKLAKKRILFISCLSGFIGVCLIGVGYIVLVHEPEFTSPLPFIKATLGANDDQTKQIQTFLHEHMIDVEKIQTLSPTIYQITTTDGGVILLTSAKSLSDQLSSLQRITSSLTMEGKKFVRLDLRFAKPIIVLQ
ncbi:MAG TPA: hypothetical protein VG935_03910 [Patescibacteria group bacterium]|nr:hypothetical protein [Patescibacteria group bacterium]